MKKLAVFVEGNTELVFVEELLCQIAGYQNISIDRQVMHGGVIRILRGGGSNRGDEPFHALLVNCESDGKVKPAILERRDSLKAQGYEAILGLRDLYPEFERGDLDRLASNMQKGLTDPQIFIAIVIAVMEIETWFLKEWTHLQKVSPQLTLAAIQAATGIDLSTREGEEIRRPAALLNQIYELVGRRYRKKAADAYRTVRYLDFDRLYAVVRAELKALDEFMSYVDAFTSPYPRVGG